MKAMFALASVCLATSAFAMPNPASTNCANLGGTTVLFNGTDGQVGFCKLDKALIEEWTLDRATNVDPSTGSYGCSMAVDDYLSHPDIDVGVNGNPASLYCAAVGGTSVSYTDDAGNAWGACQFSDNSQIDEWTLFNGPNDAGNAMLTQQLSQCLPQKR